MSSPGSLAPRLLPAIRFGDGEEEGADPTSKPIEFNAFESGAFHFGTVQPRTWLKRLVVRTLVRPLENVKDTL